MEKKKREGLHDNTGKTDKTMPRDKKYNMSQCQNMTINQSLGVPGTGTGKELRIKPNSKWQPQARVISPGENSTEHRLCPSETQQGE